jgi:hypothetical protein
MALKFVQFFGSQKFSNEYIRFDWYTSSEIYSVKSHIEHQWRCFKVTVGHNQLGYELVHHVDLKP